MLRARTIVAAVVLAAGIALLPMLSMGGRTGLVVAGGVGQR